MTGKCVPFEAWHAMDIVARNNYDAPPIALQPEFAAAIEATGGSFTYIVGDEIVACGGCLPQWPGRYQAWMFFTPEAGPHMRRITRIVKAGMERLSGRIEMTVIKDYEKGHRWAKMLGFEVETPTLKRFGPAGEDHTGYVRIN